MQLDTNMTDTDKTTMPPPAPAPAQGATTTEVNAEDLKVVAEKYEQEIEQLRAESADFKDRYMRQVAELDNMRKRNDREKADLRKFGAESLVKELLPVLDGFDKVETGDMSANPETVIQGMMLLKKSLFDVLTKHGLKPIETANASFDPNFHQAIQRVEQPEAEADTILDTFAKGYLLHDRLISPSIVSVAVPVEPTDV